MSASPEHGREAIRASVLDVFVQLGAFDRNNPITQWMFEDYAGSGSGQGAGVLERDRDKEKSPRLGRSENRTEREVQEAMRGRGRRDDHPRSEAGPESVDVAATPDSDSTPSRSRFGMFRSKSKSRTRTVRKRDKHNRLDPGPESADYGDTSTSPTNSSSKSKSKLRFFSTKNRGVDPSSSILSASSSSVLDTELPSPLTSSSSSATGSAPTRNTLRSVFGSRRTGTGRDAAGLDMIGEDEHGNAEEEEWEHLAPMEEPQPFHEDYDLPHTEKLQPDGAPSARAMTEKLDADPYPLPRRFSFAIPRAALQRQFTSAKHKVARTRRPPSLIISDEMNARAISKSLPPSPFILVAPESEDATADPTTPYVLCAPIDDSVSVATRFDDPSPVYPISVSKTIRRSVLMDNLDLSGPASDEGPSLRRSISLQAFPGDIDIMSSPVGMGMDVPNLKRSTSIRGREAPFPTRPVLALPLSLSTIPGDARNLRLSLDARASVLRQRYNLKTGYGRHLSGAV